MLAPAAVEREHAARGEELVTVVQTAAQAEDRRLRQLQRARGGAPARRVLEQRFDAERRHDARRITDLRQEAADYAKAVLTQPPAADTAPPVRKIRDREMAGGTVQELAFLKSVYSKFDAPLGKGGTANRPFRPPPAPRGAEALLLEQRMLLTRLSSLVDYECAARACPPTGRSAAPSDARSVASHATSASFATFRSAARPPAPRPTIVPRLDRLRPQ
ncbi:hypothetical protein M885DRAFT_543921 [Pelagophyceae sp. CCMP2097]|nr:hypothetical protein M885DRAFT_543921 [Pelagophyceae sp. CCMP2097]